ncbi:glycosyltransferase family 1 protein [uncultured Pseudodesulfovibrio sp.]|uniref:glycosyltransferase family 4 protein n=1 Tax=uncultured Pseudodesulfovibrio sp. TaxID=2035858 RepID=UPI0029C8D2C9|nr:glycosyltransferase family 1 protein [uncultured Pseudodesulfovibrio sp.]
MDSYFDHQIFACQRFGGISRTFCEQAEALAALGGRVRVLAPRHRNGHLADLDPRLVSGDYSMFENGELSGVLDSNRRISDAALPEGVHILHETYYTGYHPRSMTGRRVVTLHDLVHELMPEKGHPSDRTAEHKKLAVDRADHVVCVSQNTLVDAVKVFGLAPEKATVIHHGVHGKWFGEPAPLEAGEDRPFILVVGNRGGYKFFTGLLTALAMTGRTRKDHAVVCFGGGPLDPAESKLAAELGLLEMIRVTSGGDDLLHSLYGAAAALVYPSEYEGFGLPVLEAMASGCPVICSDAASLPEVAGDAAAMFPSCNVGALAEQLDTVLYSESLRSRLVSRGRERARAFTWERNAEKLLAVYESLV